MPPKNDYNWVDNYLDYIQLAEFPNGKYDYFKYEEPAAEFNRNANLIYSLFAPDEYLHHPSSVYSPAPNVVYSNNYVTKEYIAPETTSKIMSNGRIYTINSENYDYGPSRPGASFKTTYPSGKVIYTDENGKTDNQDSLRLEWDKKLREVQKSK